MLMSRAASRTAGSCLGAEQGLVWVEGGTVWEPRGRLSTNVADADSARVMCVCLWGKAEGERLLQRPKSPAQPAPHWRVLLRAAPAVSPSVSWMWSL